MLSKLRIRFTPLSDSELCDSVCGKSLCLGRYQPDKRRRLLRLYHEGNAEIRSIASSLFRLAGQNGKEGHFWKYEAGRSDILCRQQWPYQPCGSVYWKRTGGSCGKQAQRHQDFYLELPLSGSNPQHAGLKERKKERLS